MSRTVQPGDLVTLTLNNVSSTYLIQKIVGLDIYISPADNPNVLFLLYPSSTGQYVVQWAEEIPYQFKFVAAPILTGNQYIDIPLLARLEESMLETVCTSNDYTTELCQRDDLWTLKIIQQFGEKYLSLRPDAMNFRDYYAELVQIQKSRKYHQIVQDIQEGKIYILERLVDLENKSMLTRNLQNVAARYGQIPILDWFEKQGFSFDEQTARRAASGGHVPVLNWLEARHILPNLDGAYKAALNGHIPVLEWLEARGILPPEGTADVVILGGNFATVKWLETRGFLPSEDQFQQASDKAAAEGDIPFLEWLENREVHFNKTTAYEAAFEGHIPVLEWLENRGILLDFYVANGAAAGGHIPTLEWLEHRGILPDRDGADYAAGNGLISTLEWLEARDILPTWYAYENIYTNLYGPQQYLIPSDSPIHEVGKWLKDRDIPLPPHWNGQDLLHL